MKSNDARTQANRRNAQRSTGPRTSRGKAKARLNAVKHGALSESVVVLPTEDAAAFERLAQEVREEVKPLGPVEHAYALRVANLLWRLRRISVAEVGIFSWFQARTAEDEARDRLTISRLDPSVRALSKACPEAAALAEDALQTAEAAGRTVPATLARPFLERPESLTARSGWPAGVG